MSAEASSILEGATKGRENYEASVRPFQTKYDAVNSSFTILDTTIRDRFVEYHFEFVAEANGIGKGIDGRRG